MQGWECPKCGKCYAPHVDECKACNSTAVVIPIGDTTNVEPWLRPPFKISNAIYVTDADGTLVHLNGKR